MPTFLTHAAVPLALGLGLGQRIVSRRLLVAGLVASVLPDLDVLAFRINVAYSDAFGHRGATHSIAFALLLGLVAVAAAPRLRAKRAVAFAFVAACAASHGLLDMFTDGGHGVALWWPWSAERVFAPWQVIEVSPLSFRRIAGPRGLEVLQSELLWVWLPAVLLGVALFVLRQQSSNISVNADVRERAFVEGRHESTTPCSSEHLATRGRRLP